MTAYTPESLAALDLKELRSLFVRVVGHGPGSRSREALIAGVLAAESEEGQEPVAEVEPTVVEANFAPVAVEAEFGTDQQTTTPVDVPLAEVEAPPVQAEPLATPVPSETAPVASKPPIGRVRLVGLGANDGSEMTVPLLSLSGTTAEVKLLGKKLRFHVADGSLTVHRKGPDGWRLDTSTLPAPRAMSEDEVASMPLRDLSTEQLQAVYAKAVGKETDATNREYLVWRVRQARQGKGVATSGSRAPRSTEDSKIIQLRLPVSTMDALDSAWKRYGFPNRNAFFRAGLAKLLQEHGEDAVAKLIV